MKSEAALDQPRLVERDGRIVIVIPMQFKRRGGRKEIIVPRGVKAPMSTVTDNPAVQKPLAIAVARAHRWQKLVDQGRYESMNDLADAAGLDRAYVRRIVNLTLLSPELVRAILEGTEPSGLSITQLIRDVPMDWTEQGNSH